ncbi:MAG: transporter substrate-binding domain-containing protein [Clostridia bacterium]|nr:transporter substrate-binding domain-containing protein [Clostridia bacterium]
MKKTVLFILIAAVLVATIILAATFIPKAIESRKLVVGVTDTSMITCYKDPNGDFSGVNCDVITAVAEEGGYTVEFKEIVWAERDRLLKNGEIDCYVDGTAKLGDQNITTDVFVYSTQTLIYKSALENDNISVEVAKNYPCAVQKDSFNYEYLLSKGAKNIKEYSTLADVVTAIKNGTCVVGIIDYGVYLANVKNNEEYKNITSGILTDNCGYRLVFSPKSENKVKKINTAIDSLKTNGGIKEVLSQYHSQVENSFLIY